MTFPDPDHSSEEHREITIGRRATAATNLVLIEPDLLELFPDSEAVNRALRLLADTARVALEAKPRRKRR